MDKAERDALYDKICIALTDYENSENTEEVNMSFLEEFYNILVEVQNFLEELITPIDENESADIRWKKYKAGQKQHLSVVERNTLPSKKYGGFYIDFPTGDTKDQEEWYISIPDLLKIQRE